MSPTQTPPVHCQNPRRLIRVLTLRPSPRVEGLGCREYSFEAHLCGSYVHCDLPVRFRACSPPRLTATQLARSSVLNRLIAPAGLSPALTPASRAHQLLNVESRGHVGWKTAMARPFRVELPGASYHVTARDNPNVRLSAFPAGDRNRHRGRPSQAGKIHHAPPYWNRSPTWSDLRGDSGSRPKATSAVSNLDPYAARVSASPRLSASPFS